jgi:hypothetical protein
MRRIAVDRDMHNIIQGGTVSVFADDGTLISVDGEASAWASARFAHLQMRRGVYAGSPRFLLLAARMMPTARREDFLTEVFDEIQSAREEGLPVGRRYASIALRAIPNEMRQRAVRARQPGSDPV